jgi:hypothetical protein
MRAEVPRLRADASDGGRGMATPAAFLLVLACATLTLSAVMAIHQATYDHRARREAACARLGARGGLTLGRAADGRPDLVSPDLAELRVTATSDPAGHCVVTATAACGEARRTLADVRANPVLCSP